MKHDHLQHNSEPQSFWSSRYLIGLIVFGAIATYFLLSEHRAHFFGALPFLLLLACPLMHVFMHGGHGHDHEDPSAKAPPGPSQPPKTGD
ncbi:MULTISPECIES: DUF2933 domain-containing protein [unclassified Pseudomonas]|uniref:DUF2933 domain-containing protein n=1 Tax=unclassified Pseudomonas TaxID=196821 RepID=UPI000C86B18D|nr:MULTISPECIES: DUF2933 domain-containing protein [unclassified Pseudomonas]PMV97099.1 hypothetical protein C1X55_17355 [Pseudomonas sp. GW460-C8]PMW10101.1 hypothetical protein C1X40_31730 [Pseudomonas sp. GW456-11-11-14-TSB2]PMW21043.1 hypothetical protein C1X53_16495 [Pseudomonas sp. GW456-E6]PMW27487.1 hypothetical protein C1X48_33970 [Pseudomonas sp. FW305-3-2-15-A-R2A1]PMW36526.1 hypothetical protein C1X45_14745 [Pseudomonas sp. GW460-7]